MMVWLVDFYGMSTLVGLFYAEDVLFYSFLMDIQSFWILWHVNPCWVILCRKKFCLIHS